MSKTTPEEAIALARKHQIDGIWTGPRIRALAALIDEMRGVDAEPYAYEWLTPNTNGTWCANFGFNPPKSGVGYKNVKSLYTHPAPSQPVDRVAAIADAYKAEVAAGRIKVPRVIHGAPSQLALSMLSGDEIVKTAEAIDNPDELEPVEFLASRLIDAWCASHGKQIPWAKAVEITAIVTKMPDAERDRLLNLD